MALLPENVKSGAKEGVPRLVIFSPGYADQSWENSLYPGKGGWWQWVGGMRIKRQTKWKNRTKMKV